MKLFEVGWVPGLGQAERNARCIEILDCKPHQPVVASEIEPGQRLHLGIGHVLQPLPGDIADEGLLRVECESTPGCVPDKSCSSFESLSKIATRSAG
jgi:hypothetical protein